MKLPEFQSAYREARRAAIFQANARLQQAAIVAASTIIKLMVDGSTPPAVRVRAADFILARGNQGLENEDLEARLAAVERSVALEKSER